MTYPRFYLLLLGIGMTCYSYAQTPQVNPMWSATQALKYATPSQQNSTKERLFELNKAFFEQTILDCPKRFEANPTNQKVAITLPFPNGDLQTFEIEEATVLGAVLSDRFPTIRSFVGYGVEQPDSYARFAWSPHGLQGIIISKEYGTIYIDPLETKNPSVYKSYFKEESISQTRLCQVIKASEEKTTSKSADPQGGDCLFRTFRLAVACTAEYTNYHGGTLADALAALNATITRVNAIFERELAISLELVDNNADIIFFDPNTDPFLSISPNGFFDSSEMLGQAASTIDQIIGNENYDVGHLFITGLGGIAGVGVACNANDKALGLSGLNTPEGPLFDIDIVAHELGHQFGADHTFSGDDGTCFRNASSLHAVEPGSGSTIMSYAGLCEGQNVTSMVDPYFHALSLEQINTFLVKETSCANTIPLDNEPPTADAGRNYFIPRGTPFVLSGEGNDTDGDNLTYNWEQMDNGTGTQPPVSIEPIGPLFRSSPPTNSPVRYFPNLPALAANHSTPWEVLPAVERAIDFRFTVRDNHAGGGCTAEDDIRLLVDGATGPFRVIERDFTKWTVGAYQNIQWNVAGTTNTNISADQVDVFLSVDGGLSFPILIVEGIPNIGSAEIIVPNHPSEQARIMVKGHDHIFFDINNEDFDIEAVKDDVVINIEEPIQRVCMNQKAVYPLDIGISGSVTGSVSFAINGLPAGVVADFSAATLRPPGRSVLSLSNFSDIRAGTYNIEVEIQSVKGTQERTLQLIILDATTNLVELQSPPNNVGGINSLPTFEWQSVIGNNSYIFQISNTPSFDELLEETSLTNNKITLVTPLASNTRYYWRVQLVSECATDSPSVFTFTTASTTCKMYQSEDLPKSISTSGMSNSTSAISISDQGKIIDINIHDIDIKHSWISDISIGLISPKATVTLLLLEPCFGDADLLISFDDEATNNYSTISCPPTLGETYTPIEALSNFDGEAITGDWNMVVLDQYDDDGGAFQSWSMEVCFLDELSIPALTLTVEEQEESCLGSGDGQATVFPVDGKGGYTYLWSTGDTSPTVKNLLSGTYTVTVSDSDTSLVQTVEIPSGTPLDLSFTTSEALCPDMKNGFIRPTGDTTNLSFLWNDGTTYSSLLNIGLGAYTVTITNREGCTAVQEYNIEEEQSIQAILAVKDVSCHDGNDGSIEIEFAEERTLFYQWSGAANPFEGNLRRGEYGITITTESGCSSTLSAFINEPPPLEVAISIDTTAVCFGETTKVAILPSGGTPPYKIECADTVGICEVVTERLHQVVVRDTNGCVLNSEIEVELPTEIQLSLLPTKPSTIIVEDGRIETVVEGGTGPYTFSWNPGDTTQNLIMLGKGRYEVTVEDVVGCSKTASVQLESDICYQVEMEVHIDYPSCMGIGLGAIEVSPMSGEPPFYFQWNTGDTLQFIADIPIGFYELTVTDALGCTGILAQSLIPDSDIEVDLVSKNTYSCQNDRYGSLEVMATGGAGTLKYTWSNKEVGPLIDSLMEGTYTVTVEDEAGCSVIQTYAIATEDQMMKPALLDQIILYLSANGQEVIVDTMLLIDPIDTCSVFAIQFSKLNFDCEDKGENQVYVDTQFKDASTERKSVKVMVLDTLPPVFDCPDNRMVGECLEETSITYDLDVSDNCGGYELTTVSGLASGSIFPMGDTRVLYKAVDRSGNASFCDFTITIGAGPEIEINYSGSDLFPDTVLGEVELLFLYKLAFCDSINFRDFVHPSGGVPPYQIDIQEKEEGANIRLTIEVTDNNNCKAIDEVVGMVQSHIPQVRDSILPETNESRNGQILIKVTQELFPIVQYDWFLNDTLLFSLTDSLLSNEQHLRDLRAGAYTLRISDAFGCTYDYQYMVKGQVSVNTKAVEIAQQISIVPNPSDGLFTIRLQAPNNYIQDVEVFTIDGRQLFFNSSESIKSNSINVNLEAYSKGIYLVKVNTDEGIVLKKIALF